MVLPRTRTTHVLDPSLLWATSKIIIGDFALASTNGTRTTSCHDDSDHSWCDASGTTPIDLSAVTKFIDSENSDIGAVWGTETTSGKYDVLYLSTDQIDSVEDLTRNAFSQIIYFEREAIAPDPIDLMTNPFQFLFSPPPGHKDFTEIHNPDVFFQITWHCIRLIRDETKPLYTYRDPKNSVRGMIKNNSNAKREFRENYK